MHLQSLRIFIISLNANYRIAHLMPSRANDSFLPARGVLNLIHRFVVKCQCPLGLMTHFYETGEAMILSMIALVSMPSRANDSFLR